MLSFDGATKRFGAVTALDRCTFAARPGRLTGLLGPNGAGKTTAMRAVFGLVELDAGTARWQGVPVCTADRPRFGYMPEERGLYPRMRVRDQLVYLGQLCGRGAKDVTRSLDTWLERLSLAGRAADRLDTLSHGNQQRVQLIAALVNPNLSRCRSVDRGLTCGYAPVPGCGFWLREPVSGAVSPAATISNLDDVGCWRSTRSRARAGQTELKQGPTSRLRGPVGPTAATPEPLASRPSRGSVTARASWQAQELAKIGGT